MIAGLDQIPKMATGVIIDHFHNQSEQRLREIENKKFEKIRKFLDSKAPKSTSNTKPSEGLTTGFLEGESIEQLGRRKWKEYENHLSELSDSATPAQAQKALKEIQDNITKSFPCKDCRINSIENFKEFPLTDKSVTGKKDAEARLCTFHNIVNDQLGKPITVKCSPVSK